MIPVITPDNTDRLGAILGRDATFSDEVDAAVDDILDQVRGAGDSAVLALTEQFDGVRPDPVKMPPSMLEAAADALDGDLRDAIAAAAENIRAFHEKQVRESWFTDDGDGVILGQRVVPMERVGLYVPGGTAFYPSSLLMNAIPAQVAGVEDIHLVSPPQSRQPSGAPHPLVLATAAFLGLGAIPERIHFREIGVGRRLAIGLQKRLDPFEPPGEFRVGAAKRGLGAEVHMPREVGHDEHQVAEFFLDVIRVVMCHCFMQFFSFFLYLVDDM